MTRHYQDSDTRREQIARAALQAIIEDGVALFRTRSIADRVGITDGTIFRHFANKEEIVVEALRLLDAEMQAGFSETGDALADLEVFFRHRAAFVGAQGAVGRLIFSSEFVRLAGDQGTAMIAGWRKNSVGYLVGKLEQLQTAGQVRLDLPVAALSMLVQGILMTFAMEASLGMSGSSSELDSRVSFAWGTVSILLGVRAKEVM